MITYLRRCGLMLGALANEVDDTALATMPEFQRGWYAKDAATGKNRLDLTKVEVEDVTALRSTVAATRAEVAAAKAASKKALEEALAPYAGIDPVKTKELMSKFENADEAALIAAGKIDEVIARRMEKLTIAQKKLVDEATERERGALEVASTFMERVLDNEVRVAVTGKVHDSALKNGDVLRAAREIFSLNDEGKAVQIDKDGNEVLGANGKTSFSPEEWIESMRETAPHWFPAKGSGGGAGGSSGKGSGGKDLTGLSPTARMTEARKGNK